MKLYFSNSQIPELAGLTRHQRKAVYQCGLEAFFADQPSRVWAGTPWIFGGLFSGAVVGWLVVAGIRLTHFPLLVIIAGGLAGVVLGIFIATQILTAQLRPYLRRVLEERKNELRQIND